MLYAILPLSISPHHFYTQATHHVYTYHFLSRIPGSEHPLSCWLVLFLLCVILTISCFPHLASVLRAIPCNMRALSLSILFFLGFLTHTFSFPPYHHLFSERILEMLSFLPFPFSPIFTCLIYSHHTLIFFSSQTVDTVFCFSPTHSHVPFFLPLLFPLIFCFFFAPFVFSPFSDWRYCSLQGHSHRRPAIGPCFD